MTLPLILLHAGIADRRMWEANDFGDRRVLAPDLRGFGERPLEPGPFSWRDDVLELLDTEGIDRAVVVGASNGGRVAIDTALEHPERVAGLVLVGPALSGWEWSPEVQAFGEREDELLEAGEVHEAVKLNLRMWVDGPSRRPNEVEAAVRAKVAAMQKRIFELGLAVPDAGPELRLDPPAAGRLAELTQPTLVVVGALDVPDMLAIAATIAAEAPNARLETIADTAHVPSLEQPAEFDRIVRAFLDAEGF